MAATAFSVPPKTVSPKKAVASGPVAPPIGGHGWHGASPTTKENDHDTAQPTQRQRPALIAYHVPDRRNAPWLRIGAAWPHQNGGGFSLKIELLPLDVLKSGEMSIQLRAPDPKDEDDTADHADTSRDDGYDL